MAMTIVSAALVSTGLWAFLTYLLQRKDKKSAVNKLLLGLAHDRICYLAEHYIERGYVTRDEFENLHDYLYIPYVDNGGNGTAKRLMEAVGKLPVKRKEAKS